MDELTIDGKTYLSSKRAATVTGYAKDYVGQLCREGRVEAKLVGRSWYVYEPSIREHRFNDERAKASKQSKGKGTDIADSAEEPSEKTNIQAVWDVPSYSPDPIETIPGLGEEDFRKAEEQKEATLSEMQSAWQDWFSTHTPVKKAESAPEVPQEEPEAMREEPTPVAAERTVLEQPVPLAVSVGVNAVPMRMIMSDIAPVRGYEHPIAPVPAPIRRSEARSKPARQRNKQKMPQISITIARSLLIGFIVVCLSITLLATGLADAIHVGILTDSPFISFFQGIQHIEK